MKTNFVRVLAITALAAAASWGQEVDKAQANSRANGAGAPIVGTWDVAVTVVDCTTGSLIRNVHSVQMFQADGTFSETTNSGLRGSSVGYWFHENGTAYGAAYFFFRYAADGSATSFAKAANTITLSPDGSQFTVTATIKDYDANNALISTGCVTQTAKKL